MKATFKDARLFRNLIGALSALIDEADITATADGLKLRSMDITHIAMVDFGCTKKMFETYECVKDQVFRVNLVNLAKLLGRANPGDALELTFDTEDKKIKFILKGESTKRFTMGTLEPTNIKAPDPSQKYDAKIMITSKSFKELLDDSKVVADSVLLTASSDKFTALAKADTAKVEIEKLIADEVMEISVRQPVSSKYVLEMLGIIVGSGASVSDLAVVEFSADKPIKISFTLPEGKLDYYLAPRVGDKD